VTFYVAVALTYSRIGELRNILLANFYRPTCPN
jgi:hypothetical protein